MQAHIYRCDLVEQTSLLKTLENILFIMFFGKMLIHYNLFLLITILAKTAEGNTCKSKDVVTLGKRLNETGFVTFHQIKLMECARKCMVRNKCKSFNYERNLKICELKSVNRNTTTIIEAHDYLYGEPSDWPTELIGACADVNCPENSMCIELIKGHVCVKSDCDDPPSRTHAYVNSGCSVIGFRRTYACTSGYVLTGDDVAVCSSNGEWTHPTFNCTGVCSRRWKNVLKHDNNGTTIYGSKSELLGALKRGAQLRIHGRRWGGTGGLTADIQNARVINNNVCAQTLLHISKLNWSSISADAYWFFVIVCTSGHVHINRWFVGVHISKSDTKISLGLTWYIRELGCTEGEDATLYSHTSDGTTLLGNLQSLFLSLSQGHDVRAVEPNTSFAFNFNNMQWDRKLAAGQSIWQVSQTTINSSHIEFLSDAYWWFTMWSTSGKNDISRWDIGSNNSRGHSDRSVGLKWFVDPCWTLAYEHDDHGNNIDGSRGFLVEAVLNGHRVKAVMGNYSIEADMITIRNGHVNAQLLGHISKADPESFTSSLFWYWELISTTGSFRTYKYIVGSTTNIGTTTGNRKVAWFVDTRQWKHVLSNDENGQVTHGSKSDMATAVQNGALVRYALRFPGNSSVRVLQADNIVVNAQEIGAQSIRSISQTDVDSSETALQSNPYWWFTVTSSTGSVSISRWTVGQHEARGNAGDTTAVDWFINE